MIYWYRKRDQRKLSFFMTVLHGILVTGSRLVGLPIIALPFLYEFYWNQNRRIKSTQYIITLGVSLTCSLGCLGYFAFNYFKFDKWDLPFIVQKIGWGNKPRYLAPLYPKYYFPDVFNTGLIDILHKLCIPVFFILFVVTYQKLKSINKKLYSESFIWLMIAVLFYYVCFSGKAENNMYGMIRYMLPGYYLLLLIGFKEKLIRPAVYELKKWSILEYIVILGFGVLQVILMSRHLNGDPVS